MQLLAEQSRLSSEVGEFVQNLYSEMPERDLKQYLRLLCADIIPTLSDLENAVKANDLGQAVSRAHRLRNITGAIGASKLRQSFTMVEKSLETGVFADCDYERLRCDCGKLVEAVNRLCEGE